MTCGVQNTMAESVAGVNIMIDLWYHVQDSYTVHTPIEDLKFWIFENPKADIIYIY